jgi:hypothetical protein
MSDYCGGIPNNDGIKITICFLDKEIQARLDTFNRLKNENYTEVMIFGTLSIVLSAIVTLLLGLKIKKDTANPALGLTNFALVVSVLVTAVNSYQEFRDPKSFWIRYTVTSNSLRSLQFKLQNFTIKVRTSSISKEDIQYKLTELCNDYQNILDETNEDWKKIRINKNQNDKNSAPPSK